MTVAFIMRQLHQRLLSLLGNHHTSSMTYQPCCKCLNECKKPFNTQISILENEKTLQTSGNESRSWLKEFIWTSPHPETHWIISWLLMLSPLGGPSGMNRMNCLLVVLKRHQWNCYSCVQNIFCIVETTEKLILIDIVCEVGKSLLHNKYCDSVAPFGIAHHSGKSSTVLNPGHGLFVIRSKCPLVRRNSLLQCCFAVFAFSSWYCNTSFWDFISKIWRVASWRFNCRYSCSESCIAHSGSSVIAYERLRIWWIWSEKWFKICIFTKLKSNLLTRCCSIINSIYGLSSSTRGCIAAVELLFQAGSLSQFFCLSKERWFLKASGTCFVDLLAQNPLKILFWLWNSSRYFTMYSIVASVCFQYCAISWQFTKFMTHHRASVKGILWFVKWFTSVAVPTQTVVCPSGFNISPPQEITSQYSLLYQLKPGYVGIITQSWLKWLILKWWLRKDITQSIKCLSILR